MSSDGATASTNTNTPTSAATASAQSHSWSIRFQRSSTISSPCGLRFAPNLGQTVGHVESARNGPNVPPAVTSPLPLISVIGSAIQQTRYLVAAGR